MTYEPCQQDIRLFSARGPSQFQCDGIQIIRPAGSPCPWARVAPCATSSIWGSRAPSLERSTSIETSVCFFPGSPWRLIVVLPMSSNPSQNLPLIPHFHLAVENSTCSQDLISYASFLSSSLDKALNGKFTTQHILVSLLVSNKEDDRNVALIKTSCPPYLVQHIWEGHLKNFVQPWAHGHIGLIRFK